VDAFKANDKKQPLYVVTSAVSKGGAGEMETVAFNSAEGDFFGLSQGVKDSKTEHDTQQSWYRRIWNVVKRTSSTLYSVVYKALFSDPIEAAETILPPGTNGMGGLVNRRKRIVSSKQREESIYHPTQRMNNEGKAGIFPCLEGRSTYIIVKVAGVFSSGSKESYACCTVSSEHASPRCSRTPNSTFAQ
jgi:hypothetical protein